MVPLEEDDLIDRLIEGEPVDVLIRRFEFEPQHPETVCHAHAALELGPFEFNIKIPLMP
jgi:hypothetical protein